MTRTITHSEFQAASGEPVYVSTVHYASAAERLAGDAAVQRVVVAAAFVPFGDKGEPFDPPEEWPSDKTAAWVAPPNCDGFGHEPTQSGQVLAHAMHTAAEGGEGCDSVACSITQGVSD